MTPAAWAMPFQPFPWSFRARMFNRFVPPIFFLEDFMFLEQRFSSCGPAVCRLCLCLVAWAALGLSLQQDPCFPPLSCWSLLVGRPPVLSRGQLLQTGQRALGQRCRGCTGVWDVWSKQGMLLELQRERSPCQGSWISRGSLEVLAALLLIFRFNIGQVDQTNPSESACY